jgi:hypothetical protein
LIYSSSCCKSPFIGRVFNGETLRPDFEVEHSNEDRRVSVLEHIPDNIWDWNDAKDPVMREFVGRDEDFVEKAQAMIDELRGLQNGGSH